uniref:histidine kinase n=1 Tax=Caldicellulosiruptor owensensis TaxID=55205 RepID=A0A7C5V273_9FIRM
MSIRIKIYLSYMGLILFIFVVFVVLFYAWFEKYLIDQMKEDNLRFARLIEFVVTNQNRKTIDLKPFEFYFESLESKILQDYIVIVSSDGVIEYSNKELDVETRLKIMKIFDENKDVQYGFEMGSIKEKPCLFTIYGGKSKSVFVIIIADLARVLNFKKRFFLLILQTAGLSCIFAATVAIFISRKMIEGLLRLKEAIKQASQLRFNKKVEITTNDEIGMIATEFNRLIQKIDEYNQAQIRFLQNISHELKTPLTSVRGYAEMLKEGILDKSKMESAADKIIWHVDRLKSLINQIIDLTKIESVENYFCFEKSVLEEVIFEAILENEGHSLSKEVTIEFAPQTKTYVICDKLRLKEAFSNIISNCIKYANNKVTIEIKSEKDEFEVRIEDDGEGFLQGEIDKIFERFYKGKRGESGLGLSIAKAIFDKHGFSIEAENKISKGANFKIRGKTYKEQ